MLLAFGMMAGPAGSALAQEDAVPIEHPIDVERFRPMVDPFGYGLTESSTTLKNLQVGVGLWGNYSDDSLVLVYRGQRVLGPGPTFPDGMLDQRTMTNFQAGLGLADRFSFHVELPVLLWQEGFEPAAPDSPVSSADVLTAGLGDLRLTPKVVLADIHSGYPVGLALLSQVSLPTGSRRSFIGEGDATVTPLVALEVADGSVHERSYLARAAVNVGGRFKRPDPFRDVTLGSELVYRAALSAHPVFALEIGADLNGATAGARTANNPVEILPWVKLIPQDWVTVNAGAGFGLVPGAGSPDLRVFGGLTLSPWFDPLQLDRDHDGVPNKFDQCINIPEDRDGFQDDDGCPDPDNDQDGIPDVQDGCPDDPEDRDGFQDDDGCPDPDNDDDRVLDINDGCIHTPEDHDGWDDLDGCPDPDNDGDRILDPLDRCPNAAETVNGYDDADGCPDERPHVDTDGDGYEDDRDRCPTEPEDFDHFEDEDGCPDLDNDRDGIFDLADACPFEPETVNGYLDDDGCPDTAPSRVIVTKTKIEITEKIYFEYNRAVIQAQSHELLNEVARVITEHPHLARIRVEGHTDSDGSDGYNQKLSQRRAEAVRDYLVGAGVAADRLEAAGYGESQPIDTNQTVEGKTRNRRVEFTILDGDG